MGLSPRRRVEAGQVVPQERSSLLQCSTDPETQRQVSSMSLQSAQRKGITTCHLEISVLCLQGITNSSDDYLDVAKTLLLG